MNIGLASLYFSKMKNVEKVYAFEPFKKTYEHAIHNIKLNSNIDGKKIEPFNIALSDKDGEMEIMYDEEHSSGMSLIYGINSNESKDKEMIKYRKASDIFEKIISKNRNNTIVCKIDCEGSEYSIIKDLRENNLFQKVNLYLMEWHLGKSDEIEQILKEEDYSYILTQFNPRRGICYAWKNN